MHREADPAPRARRRAAAGPPATNAAGPGKAITAGRTAADAASAAHAAETAAVRAGVLLAILAVLGCLAGGCGKLFPSRSEGEQLYVDNCADCHGVDGRGNTVREMGQPYADLIDDVWKFGGDDSSLANTIREGSFGLMPGFQEKLSDRQIEALVAYLKVLRRRAGAGSP